MNRILLGALLPIIACCASVASAQDATSCAASNDWAGTSRGPIATFAPSDAAGASRAWPVSWRGRGLSGVHGRRRARLARAGGLWSVSPAAAGLDARAAIAAFRGIGVRARAVGTVVEFRARSGDATAARALAAAGPARAAATTGATVDVAMFRLEGRYSPDATAFVEGLPAGIEVFRFGTGYEARVPASMVGPMWDAVDREGPRRLLVGASGSVRAGAPIASVVRSCGGTALSRRFPTPGVSAVSPSLVRLDVDGHGLPLAPGDVSLTVQNPVDGRGLEAAVATLAPR